jgi:hypothetical protein
MAARRWCDVLILGGIALQIVASHGWRASDLIAKGCAGGLQS